jgi:hypothetical protein
MIAPFWIGLDSLDTSCREIGLPSANDRPSNALPARLVVYNPVTHGLFRLP